MKEVDSIHEGLWTPQTCVHECMHTWRIFSTNLHVHTHIKKKEEEKLDTILYVGD